MLPQTDTIRNAYTHKLWNMFILRLTFHSKILAAEALSSPILFVSDVLSDGCSFLESLHPPFPPPHHIHRWPLPLSLSLTALNTLSRMLSLAALLHSLLLLSPSFVSAAPGCAQDGGDLEIILDYIWLQMWGCNLQIPALRKRVEVG